MNKIAIALGLGAALLAGCGGGGGTRSGGGGGLYGAPPVTQPSAPPVTQPSAPPVTQPSAPPMTQPSAPPTTQPSTAPSAVLQTANINGGQAFITASQQPVYTFDGDTTANQSTCTGSCLAIWPAVSPPTTTLPAPFASFTRSDTNQLQLTYKGKPLYTFVSDTQPLIATGDGFQNFHIARP